MSKKSNRKRAAKRAYREAEKAAKRNPKALWAVIAILLVLVIVAGAVLFWLYRSGKIDAWKNGGNDSGINSGGNPGGGDGSGGNQGGSNTGIGMGAAEDIASADFSIHFLELGVSNAGDCVLIKSGNTEVLIDAGAKSATAPTKAMLDYVAKYCTDGVLEYVIATHAHEDHIAGFVGQAQDGARTGFLYQYKIGTIIQFARHKTTSQIFQRYTEAVEYCAGEGTNVYTALDCVTETNGAKATYYLDDAQTVSLNIINQKHYSQNSSSENNYSVCMLLTQKLASGENNYLFTGDLESSGESSLVDMNPDLPHCVLYKGGHHGSSTSASDKLLDKITPDNIAICTCAGTYEYADKPTADNPNNYLNTFPTQEAIDRMSKHTDKIYVTTLGIIDVDNNYKTTGFTSMNGNIVFYYGKGKEENDSSLKLWCSNNTTILKETEWFQANRTWNGV